MDVWHVCGTAPRTSHVAALRRPPFLRNGCATQKKQKKMAVQVRPVTVTGPEGILSRQNHTARISPARVAIGADCMIASIQYSGVHGPQIDPASAQAHTFGAVFVPMIGS